MRLLDASNARRAFVVECGVGLVAGWLWRAVDQSEKKLLFDNSGHPMRFDDEGGRPGPDNGGNCEKGTMHMGRGLMLRLFSQVAVLAWVVGALAGSDAAACSCERPPATWPADGSVVPPEVLFLWHGGFGPQGEPDVLDADGNVVDLEWEAIGQWWRASPPSQLASGTYSWIDVVARTAAEIRPIQFTVDASLEVDAERLPTVELGRSINTTLVSVCGGGWATYYETSSEPGLEVVALDDNVDDATAMDWEDALPSRGLVGRFSCADDNGELWDGDATTQNAFRVGRFDASGRFVGWSTPQTTSAPSTPTVCHCSSGARQPVSVAQAVLFVLGLAFLGRRRRRQALSTMGST